MTGRENPAATVRLVVSDVDGTLIGKDKALTPAVLAAAKALHEAGIALCLVSSRAVEGMTQYLRGLGLETPSAALNGGLIVAPDGTILSSLVLPPDATSAAFDVLHVHGVDTWLFRGHEWLVLDRAAPYVIHEEHSVRVAAKEVPDFRPYFEGVGKITGASADYPLIVRLESELGALLQGVASVHRSSDYYLDITQKDANKGYAAKALAARLGVDLSEVACIGDMSNDVPMLREAGLAIAMGQSKEDVRQHAHFVTAPNDDDGWAKAMRDFVLPRAPGRE
ncbi:Cof-type HAD-IIB family hydrolase [Acidomonas methanolica]|uniref:Hydrolase n=1 Tax=Acidomonas methanolica NBRC 104435 TaxID=1231351 RepID=A0A023D108_ACIMT|nr:Cof-type HAD-IIB family hydrolase [Acidomonas methanolica]MBU2653413.1 Cof-type HAD-IIB family hydrolase [Acidomonas methanolica]TCS32364.1 hypothetical protein EDC31_101304 [Acidomonas methanolica]GAJ27739.1 hydrolase [Acidomonas methanolica NBRC 104435]GBQ53279.1 hydrolase [Acidomonas methanolica]GEK97801.1 hypothetical protein AME01nite_03000 [Acidomonas methanolica NBRC 104435]